MAKCNCDICKHGHKFYRIIAKLPKKDHKFMKDFYDYFLNIAAQDEYHEAILSGNWPSAIEHLSFALEEAKKIRAQENKQSEGDI